MGAREQTIQAALDRIEKKIGRVEKSSSFYYSEPWGFESEHGFCNICCVVETALEPLEMLAATQSIEKELGRAHKSVNGVYSDRTIDIDLIRAFDENGEEICCQIPNQESGIKNQESRMSSSSLLILPHPLWQERAFVTVPLAEIF